MFSIYANGNQIQYGVKVYILDKTDEISELPVNITPGSSAFIIENSKIYMLNNAHNWVEVDLSSGGGGTIPQEIIEAITELQNTVVKAVKIEDKTYIPTDNILELPIITKDDIKYYYNYIQKQDNYLFYTEYSDIDYDGAYEYFKEKYKAPFLSCSGFRKNNWFGRKYDWTYDETSTFIVKIPNNENRYGSIGVAGGLPKLTNNFVSSKEYSELYKIIPFCTLDGVNTEGLFCTINMVPVEDAGQPTHGTIPEIEIKYEINMIMLPRFILDNFAEPLTAINYIKNYVSVYNMTDENGNEIECHFMLGDSNHTYIVEFRNNTLQMSQIDDKPYMTNFYVIGSELNSDKTINYETVDTYGTGLERYDLISTSFENLNNKEDCMDLLKDLDFTRGYTLPRLSELVSNSEKYGNLTVTDVYEHPEKFDAYIAAAREAFQNRTRQDKKTWQSVHSSLYDLENKELFIYVQENSDDIYSFGYKKDIIDNIWEAGSGEHSVQTKGTGCAAGADYSVVKGYVSKTLVDLDDSDWLGAGSEASGLFTTAKGAGSRANGVSTNAKGRGASADGDSTDALADASHADGIETAATNLSEHSVGHQNLSNKHSDTYGDSKNTQFSVGIGQGHTLDPESGITTPNRKNALEVMQNGDAYLVGIGNYDGTNTMSDDSFTLQEVFDEKENTSNKVTSMSALSTDTQYPSAKAVYDAIEANKGILPEIKVTTAENANITVSKEGYSEEYSSGETGSIIIKIPEYGNYDITVEKDDESVSKVVTIDTVKQYELSVQVGAIYGVEWNRTASPVWARTDAATLFTDPVPYVAGMSEGEYSSPFDDIMPWAGMVRVTDSTAGELVAIPKFYYKWTVDSTKMKLQISTGREPGFFCSPAHMDRGDGKGERNTVYIGRYHCSSTNYKSEMGVLPRTRITRATARDAIHNLGQDIWQLDHAMWWTITMLYLVEFANANCQGTIGYGCGNGSPENMGYTDNMPYHTGTMLASKTQYGASTQYRNIEGLWDNVADWCDGIYFSGVNVYHILNPAQFSDTINGTFTGIRATENARVIIGFTFPNIEGYEWAGYPSDADVGSARTTGEDYFCDNEYYAANGVMLYVGGYYEQGSYVGLFYRLGSAASGPAQQIGARLQKLP